MSLRSHPVSETGDAIGRAHQACRKHSRASATVQWGAIEDLLACAPWQHGYIIRTPRVTRSDFEMRFYTRNAN